MEFCLVLSILLVTKEVLNGNDSKVKRSILRDDVYFHKSGVFGSDSTRTVTARDFVYSFNRLTDKKLLSPGKWVMSSLARKSAGELDITAVNDTVLDIRLESPFPPFLGILTMQYCSVVPFEAIEKADYDFLSNPIGTGPFKFQYWKDGSKLVLLKNPDYFQTSIDGSRLPSLDALSISFIKDQEVVFLQFMKGELDFISGQKGSYKDELLDKSGQLRTKYEDKIDFVKLPYLNTEYLGFQLDAEHAGGISPWHNVNLRKAVNYAINKEKMLKYLRNGIGYPANSGFIPAGLPPFRSNASYGYSFNMDSANYYISQFRSETGIAIEKEQLRMGTSAEYLDICEYVQHQLKELGLNIEIEVNQKATNNEMITFGKMPFFRKSWIADYPDAENYLSLFLSSNFSPSGPNYTHYRDSDFDQIFKEAMMIADAEERHTYYLKLDSLMMQEAPIVPLFYDMQVHFKSPQIIDFIVNPMNHLMLKYVDKEIH